MATWVLIAGLVCIFAGVLAVIVYAGTILREKSEVAASLSAIESISGPLPEEMRRAYDEPFRQRVVTPGQAWLARVARTVSGANWAGSTSRRLEMIGNPPDWDSERVLASKSLAALVTAVLVTGLLIVTGSPYPAVLWGVVLGIMAFFIPDVILRTKASGRSQVIRRALPDSIDLLTISVESGLAFDAALAQVARNTEGPLAEEFTRVLKEVQIGRSRSEALRALSERTEVDDLRIFLNSMIQAEKLGIPIADVLRVQAAEMRLKRSQRIEEQAMKLPVKMVFPVLFCIMPALFIVILGPAVLSIADALG
jgi:tight adherence protein C